MTFTARAFATLAIALARPVVAYWDGQIGTKDPMSEAMEISRRAAMDPEALRKDPDLFKKMFGKLAIEQAQAKHMDESQTTSKEDQCMACHAVVVEFEKMMVERKSQATGGHGRRDELAVADAFEKICHLDRYETMDPLDPRKATAMGRLYGGLAPPIMANACKRVVDEWQDHDEIERLLIRGGAPEQMHQELREAICNDEYFGICVGFPEVVTSKVEGYDALKFKDKPEPQCSADADADGKGKKKKKKKKRT